MQTAKQLSAKVPPFGWLIALALLVYAPCFAGGFFWDDLSLIKDNPGLSSMTGLWDIWARPGLTAEYYPVTHTTYWIEARLGVGTGVMHVVNVAILVATAYVIFLIAKRLYWRAPLAGAAMLIAHPMTVESVAWISQRKTVLAGLFCALCVYQWLRKEPAGVRWALFFFVCALLSKTQALVLAPGLLLLDAYRGKLDRNSWKQVAPMLGVGIAFAVVTTLIEHRATPAEGQGGMNLAITGMAPWHYLKTLLWPFPVNLVYPPDLGFPVGLILLVLWVFAIGILLARPATRVAGLGGAWLVVSIAPVLGLIYYPYMAFSPFADRFAYFANLALMPALVSGAAGLIPARAGALVGAGAILLLAGFSMDQSALYADPKAMWEITARRNPKAWVAFENLAVLDSSNRQTHLKAALGASPLAVVAASELARDALEAGDETTAKGYLEKAWKADPASPVAYEIWGGYLMARDRDIEARTVFDQGIEKAYDAKALKLNLASLLAGTKDPKVKDLRRALKLAVELTNEVPNDPIMWLARARVERQTGSDPKPSFEKALELAVATGNHELEAAVRTEMP